MSGSQSIFCSSSPADAIEIAPENDFESSADDIYPYLEDNEYMVSCMPYINFPKRFTGHYSYI